jgi:ketosteroid isomerase-like protein
VDSCCSALECSAVSTGRFTATVKGTGRHIEVPIAHVFKVRKGKIARWVGYADTARVAEAFALSGNATASWDQFRC